MNKKTKQEQIKENANARRANEFLHNLYNAGYRKAEEVRKETAKEILYEIDNALHDLGMFFADKGHKDYCAVCELVHLRVISKIAQEYGVEVEE